jgi:hypothetical protein
MNYLETSSNGCDPLSLRKHNTRQLAQLGDEPSWNSGSVAFGPLRRPAIRTLRGWAISVLHVAGAIREC